MAILNVATPPPWLIARRRRPPPPPDLANASGVELEETPAEQISSIPPEQTPPEKRKRKRKQSKSKVKRMGDKKANVREGGARLVKGAHGGGPGDRVCLARAVASLLEGKILMRSR